MLWIFKALAKQFKADCGLESVLPGEVVTLSEPHFEFDISSFRILPHEPGTHEHEEQVNALVQDPLYHGPSKVVIVFRLQLRADGSSSDFAAAFMKASFDAQRLAGIKAGAVIPIGLRARSLPRSGGSLSIGDEALDWPPPGSFDGKIGNVAIQTWDCTLEAEVSESVEYVVEDFPAATP